VEIGVQGGRGGIHVLICFDPATWLDNREQNDFINRFLDTAFDQIANRESEDTNCRWTLGQLLDELKRHEDNHRRSFVILAHVDQKKGALEECGASIGGFFNECFRHFVLGFQKVRSRDHWQNLPQWLGSEWKPAKVEGSDCKSLDAVGIPHEEGGTRKECWLKLGALSFDAVRLALLMKEQRVSETLPQQKNAYVRAITLEGKLIRQQRIEFSSDMTNLIGIRGSGKSSLVECLRYALDLRLNELTDEAGYKESLVDRILGSGGKITVELMNAQGDQYTVERVLRESAKVSRDEVFIPNLKPNSPTLINARYFGQKDLVRFSEERFGGELLARFTQNAPEESEAIHACTNQIEQRVLELQQGRAQLGQQEELEAQLADANEVLKTFEDQNLGEKLSQQIALEKDLKHGKESIKRQAETLQSLRGWLKEEQTLWKGWLPYQSASNHPLFSELQAAIESFAGGLNELGKVIETIQAAHEQSRTKCRELESQYESKKEDFAAVRRELKLPGDLSPDTFIKISQKKSLLEAKLRAIATLKNKQNHFRELLQDDLKRLQDQWHCEYRRKLTDIQRLNACEPSLQISLDFKAEKSGFVANLRSWTQGLQGKTLEKVAESFSDGIELYRDLTGKRDGLAALGLNEDQIAKLRDGITNNLVAALTFRPDDSVRLDYLGKPLHEHSLGQRATALMIFLLSQKEFDLLIVDQPEDDLDNQTLYTEVIQRLLQLKGLKQIVFATHSPNIPVLGDAEQILRCRYSPDAIEVKSGTIDAPAMQEEIVNVMEGGDDAFKKRKKISESWKH
jgi:predicted ATPase